MPPTIVKNYQIDSSNLRDFSYSSLPILTSTDRSIIWCSDHPSGSVPLLWNGTIWTLLHPPQPSLFLATQPASGTTVTVQGAVLSNVGTISHPTLSTTNKRTSTLRSLYTSAATAGSLSYQRIGQLVVCRGNADRIGGLSYSIKFATETLVAGNRAFVGLTDSVSNPTNIDPLANTTPGKVGVGINSNTGNWFLISNTTGSAPATLDLGSSFPVNNTNLYKLDLFCESNSIGFTYIFSNLTTNVSISGFITSNIPANTTFLAPQFWMTNNATASAVAISSAGWQLKGLS